MNQVSGPARRGPNANQEWKGRYNSRLSSSMVVAVAAHLALFVLVPNWERIRPDRPTESELIQIVPIMTEGTGGDAGQLAMAEVAEDRGELRIDEGRSPTEAEVQSLEDAWADLIYALGPPSPNVVNPVSSISAEGRGPTLQVDGLNLEQLSALTARVTQRQETLAWPIIRNPSVVHRVLYSKVTAGRLIFEPRRLVSVGVGINEKGIVDWAQVHESSGHAQVDEVAVSLFNETVNFAPARSGGSPVPVSIVISILF